MALKAFSAIPPYSIINRMKSRLILIANSADNEHNGPSSMFAPSISESLYDFLASMATTSVDEWEVAFIGRLQRALLRSKGELANIA